MVVIVLLLLLLLSKYLSGYLYFYLSTEIQYFLHHWRYDKINRVKIYKNRDWKW